MALTVKPVGTATKIVASSTATANFKRIADYVCDGTADDVQIALALTAINTAGGGKLILSEGTFTLAAGIAIPSDTIVEGQGIDVTVLKQAAGVAFNIIANTATYTDIVLRDLTLDGTGGTSNAASRNIGALAQFANVTNLTFDNVYVTGTRSGAGLLITYCTDVRISNCRLYNNGTSATGGHEADHIYIGDSFRVKITNVDMDTCTDTGIALEGVWYSAISNCSIQVPGLAMQCIAVSTSPNTGNPNGVGSPNGSRYISISNCSLVGSGSTSSGVLMGLFGEASSSPFNISLSNLNISSVKYGVRVDEGLRIDCTNVVVQLANIVGAACYYLGAGSALVNVAGGRSYDPSFTNGTAVIFVAGTSLPAFTGFDVQGTPTQFSGTVPAGTRVDNCPGWTFWPAIQSQKVVQLTNAQLLALRATPITLVAATGVGQTIIVDSIYAWFDCTTTAYTEPDTNNLAVEYADGTDILVIETTGFLTSTTDSGRTQLPNFTVATPVTNSAVRIVQNGAAEFTGGNAANTLSVLVRYHIVPTAAFT